MTETINFPNFKYIWKKYADIKNPSEYIVRLALKEYSKKLRELRPGLIAAGWASDYEADGKFAKVLSQADNLTKPVRINFISTPEALGRFLGSDEIKCGRHETTYSVIFNPNPETEIFYSRPTAETPLAEEIRHVFDAITKGRRKYNSEEHCISVTESITIPVPHYKDDDSFFTQFKAEDLISTSWLGYVPLGNVCNHTEAICGLPGDWLWVDWNVVQEFRWMFPSVRSYQSPKMTKEDFTFKLTNLFQRIKQSIG